jgi:predicted RNase H-like HicB family nuclease
MKFHILIEQGENGWLVGQLAEVPEVLSQGKTVEELRENLKDALHLFWETQKEMTEQQNAPIFSTELIEV